MRTPASQAATIRGGRRGPLWGVRGQGEDRLTESCSLHCFEIPSAPLLQRLLSSSSCDHFVSEGHPLDRLTGPLLQLLQQMGLLPALPAQFVWERGLHRADACASRLQQRTDRWTCLSGSPGSRSSLQCAASHMMAPGLQLDMAQRALLQLNAMATLLARPSDVWCSSVMDLHTRASVGMGGWGCVSWALSCLRMEQGP